MNSKKSSRKPFSYAEFKKIYSKVPRLTVDLIVTSPKGVALTLRSITPYKDHWHIPGSTLLYQDELDATARRVASEELHVEVQTPKFLGYIDYDEIPGRGFGRSISLVFCAKLKSGAIAPDEDATHAAFFSKLPPNIIPTQRTFLKKHWREIMKS